MAPSSNPSLLLVGASVRAAAQSARQAGFAPWAADLFGDVDLGAAAAEVHVCSRSLVDDLPQLWPHTPQAPWLYTGGLENYPELLDALARSRPLLGNDAATVRAVRDPLVLCASLAAAGFPTLAVRAGDQPPTAGRWVSKPLRSAGGQRVFLIDADAGPVAPRPDGYFQQQLPALGESWGATFVMNGRRAQRLGVCRHLHARPLPDAACATPSFLFGGVAVEPATLPHQADLDAIGDFLAQRFGLRGVVGVDVGRFESSWCVLEVNPRYPASAQLLESTGPDSVVGLHVRASAEGQLPRPDQIRPASPARLHIAYAPHDIVWTSQRLEEWRRLRPRASHWRAELADLPRPGALVPRGMPLCTFYLGSRRTSALNESALNESAPSERSLGDALGDALDDWLDRCLLNG
ncbi:MAG: ATP-grasp domain-containing protein [Pirellulales bacterium]